MQGNLNMQVIPENISITSFSKQTLPWIFFILLTVLFMVTDHDVRYTVRKDTVNGVTAEEIIQKVSEGSKARRIVYVFLGILGILSILKYPGSRFRLNGTLGWLVLFYIFWVFLSIIWSQYTALTVRRAILLGIVFLGAYGISLRFSLYHILYWIFFSSLSYLVLGLLSELFLGTFQPLSQGHRFSGTVHPNVQSLNCAFLTYSAFFLRNFHPKHRQYLTAIAGMAVVFLLLTKSRTALGALITAPVLYKLFEQSLKNKIILIVSIVIPVIALLLFSPILLPAIKEGILLGRADLSPDTILSLTGRIPLWQENLINIIRKPILGYGYDCFWALRQTIIIAENQEWAATHGHSAYFDLALGLGIIGLVVYILIIAAGIRRSLLYEKVSGYPVFRFFEIILIFCALDGLLESIIIVPNYFSFIIFMILMRYGWQREVLSDEDIIQYEAAQSGILAYTYH